MFNVGPGIQKNARYVSELFVNCLLQQCPSTLKLNVVHPLIYHCLQNAHSCVKVILVLFWPPAFVPAAIAPQGVIRHDETRFTLPDLFRVVMIQVRERSRHWETTS